jgi:hypothetical protein
MKPFDRALWTLGLAAAVILVVYWPTIKTAYKNRKTIGAAADVANAWQGLTK